jgi:two-component system, chemotaxis family, CheB/CheR fusion protein
MSSNNQNSTKSMNSSRAHEQANDPLGLNRPTHVLVVDDEVDSLVMYEMLLGSLGWKVYVASNGPEALLKFDESVDLVISDIGLPGMDGYDLIRELRERSRARVAAIAISGFGTSEDVRKALASGFDSHLTKPLRLSALLDTLRDIAGRTQE